MSAIRASSASRKSATPSRSAGAGAGRCRSRLKRPRPTSRRRTAGISSDCGVGCVGVATGPGVAAIQPNPTKATAPDLTAALYIPQPWGHFDLSLVLRPGMQLTDGAYLSRSFMGYGGHIGLSFKPGWFGAEGYLQHERHRG